MTEKPKTLPAIIAAERILKMATEITDKEIDEALDKLAQAEGTWGILWGLENIRRSGMDLDFYELKGKVLRFLQELRKDRHFGLAVIASAAMRDDVYE